MKVYLKVLALTGSFVFLASCQTMYLGMLFDDHQQGYQEYLASDDHYKAFMVAEWRTEDAFGDWQMSQRRINEFGKESPEEVIKILYDYCETVKAPEQTCRLYALGNQKVWTLYKPSSFQPMIDAYKARLGSQRVAAIAKKYDDERQSLDLTSAIARQQQIAEPQQDEAQNEVAAAETNESQQSLEDLAAMMEAQQGAPPAADDSVADEARRVADFKSLYEKKATEMASAAGTDATSSFTADMLAWQDIGNSTDPDDFELFLKAFEASPFAAIAKVKLDALK